MRAIIQRVSMARVTVEGEVVGSIGHGLCALVGAGDGDQQADVRYIADKIVNMRIFPDDDGKMNRSLLDTGGAVLAISQFTLYGDMRKGRRPAFVGAMEPTLANQRYEEVVAAMRAAGVTVETGVFRADMDVELCNRGPVTIMLDSRKQF